jgi:TRAP-type C4-dicarboxylate transport system permease large subunit
MPVIIIGGIYAASSTTEAAAVAAEYCLFIGLLLRELGSPNFPSHCLMRR